MFYRETQGPGARVAVTLTHTTHLNVAERTKHDPPPWQQKHLLSAGQLELEQLKTGKFGSTDA